MLQKCKADSAVAFAKGGMVGASDMSAKKMASPEKRKDATVLYGWWYD